MRRIQQSTLALLGTIGLVAATSVAAKPLLQSSETSFSVECLKQNDTYDRLIELCSAALAEPGLTPNHHVELLVALGDAYLWADDDVRAENTYQLALDRDPNAAYAIIGLAWVAFHRDEDRTAYELFKRSSEIEASSVSLGGMASAGHHAGVHGFDEAKMLLEAAIAIDPAYTWNIRELGWLHLEHGDFQQALVHFNDVIAADPEDLNARHGVIRTKFEAGDYEATLDAANALLEYWPDDYWGRLYRIRALRSLYRFAAAQGDAEELIAMFPEDEDARIERARALTYLHQRREAFEAYETALSDLGENGIILYWYADALTLDYDFPKALEIIDRSIAADPGDADSWAMKSYVEIELKEYDAALAASNTALEIDETDPWGHYYRAIALVHLQGAGPGIAVFQTAQDFGLPERANSFFLRQLVSKGYVLEAAQLGLGTYQGSDR